jgi:hypothetical protein
MGTQQKPGAWSSDHAGCLTPVAFLIVAFLGVAIGRMTHPRLPPPIAIGSITPAPPVLSAPPLPFSDVVAPPDGISTASAPAVSAGNADELVHAAVGRWVSEDGSLVEVEPPKAEPGKTPPYKLVARSVGLPRSGYGCQFAHGETRKGPGTTLYFTSWCERKKRSTLGLSLDQSQSPPLLSVVILTDGEVKVHLEQLKRVSP